MLSMTQAESGKTAKQEQERISPNHVPTIFHLSVWCVDEEKALKIFFTSRQSREIHRNSPAHTSLSKESLPQIVSPSAVYISGDFLPPSDLSLLGLFRRPISVYLRVCTTNKRVDRDENC